MVRVVSISKPILDELKEFSPEEVIVYIARVSNPQNQMNRATAPKLLKYCFDNGHWSVFEHCFITVEIKTTRAIASQILRHRSFTFQEFSQRYSEVTEIDTNIQTRVQDTKNRQNSIETTDTELIKWFKEAQEQVSNLSLNLYKEALNKGIAKEQARFLLPLSTKTTIYMSGSLRSYIHYIQLRSANGTQKEHQEIALAIKKELGLIFPTIIGLISN